jgi:hypothetical protein
MANIIYINPNIFTLSSIISRISSYDLVFVISAVIFNLLIGGIFIAQKRERPKLVRAFGISWLLLAIPFSIVFFHYISVGRQLWIMIYFGFILFYFFVELMLDYVLKIEFRSKKSTHIPYIIVEYIALFGLIGISFAIDRTWGFIISITFWVLLGCLIYLYRGKKPAYDK